MIETLKKQYWFLKSRRDDITWQIKGGCEDIDCDHFIEKRLLKKKYKPALTHSFSCVPKLKYERALLEDLLKHRIFKSLRYRPCDFCKKTLDDLDQKNPPVMFIAIKPTITKNRKGYATEIMKVHTYCRRKLKAPDGFKAF